MKKREIRLIGLDLDGTTLTTNKELTAHTKAVIEECIRKGIIVMPATGRVRSGIPDFLKEIEGMRYVLTSNGGAIVDLLEDKVIYENGIPWERALEIFDILETYDTYYDVYTAGYGWCEGRFYDHVEEYCPNDPHIQELILTSRKRIDDLRAFVRETKAPVEKMNLFFAKGEDRDRVLEDLASIKDIVATFSLWNNIEMNYHTCNKGDALIALGEILSIPKENIMACGDGINDLEMIRKVGLGVAMANAYPVVKENADFITKTNDEEGVAYAIETFCDIELKD